MLDTTITDSGTEKSFGGFIPEISIDNKANSIFIFGRITFGDMDQYDDEYECG